MTLRELAARKINEATDPLIQAMLAGSPATLHDYYRLVGKIEGLQMALREIDGLLKEEIDDI